MYIQVLPVKELVFYGLDQSAHALQGGAAGGVHLSPEAYHDKLAGSGENTVVNKNKMGLRQAELSVPLRFFSSRVCVWGCI